MSEAKNYKEGWEILEALSKGGQGETFVARSIPNKDSIGVVKVLHSQNDDERRQRMHREATNLLTLDHPGITKVLETNSHHFKDKAFRLFIVTEYIDGPTLEKFPIAEIGLPESLVMVGNIASIVDYCHHRGILHRDIKPDNIIIRFKNFSDPVVIDFGLSFNAESADDDGLTPNGQHIGNRFIILPEQKQGEAAKRDLRSDVTQIVGILFYVITGENPTFLVDQNNQKPHQRDKPKGIINALPKHQRDLLNEIFDIGFNLDIDKRWQTAKALSDTIKKVQESKPEDLKGTADYIRQLREKTTQQSYVEAKALKENLANIAKVAHEVLWTLKHELGKDDWGTEQSGYNLRNDYFQDGISLVNSVDPNIRTHTKLKGYYTGNELVVHVIENGVEKEIYRQSYALGIDWKAFAAILREHYLSAVPR